VLPLPGLHAPYTSRTSYTLLGAHYITAFPNQHDCTCGTPECGPLSLATASRAVQCGH